MSFFSMLKDIKHSQLGDSEAQFNLGNRYAAIKDYKKAIEWHTKAAAQGHAGAQHMMGLAYIEGKCVPQNYIAAIEWLTKSAEQGYVHAQYDLGGVYAQGLGGSQDYSQARRWWELAASLGHPAAIHNLQVLIKKIENN